MVCDALDRLVASIDFCGHRRECGADSLTLAVIKHARSVEEGRYGLEKSRIMEERNAVEMAGRGLLGLNRLKQYYRDAVYKLEDAWQENEMIHARRCRAFRNEDFYKIRSLVATYLGDRKKFEREIGQRRTIRNATANATAGSEPRTQSLSPAGYALTG